jgi:DNA-binding NtrC family response regulator
VRLVTADILRGAGYQVVEAGTASEALMALASDQDINLLFSDVLLRGTMGGLTLAESAHANRPNMPVILSSGAGAFGRYLEGRKSVTFLAKPYNADQLLSAVVGLLPATD